jgi:diguanylate cyclase (GGDEF)-like protein
MLASACTLYLAVFGGFYVFEVPGLGVGHFYYIPVALIALGGGTWAGIGGGVVAAGLYALDLVVTPRVPVRDILTSGTVIRSITYCSCGALIGWFASEHRAHAARLRDLADRDFLTGLANARAFDEVLARRASTGDSFVLVLGDMDDLKAINDSHGHVEGNRVLCRVADALRAQARPGDDLARIGGDQFALATEGSVEEAQRLCAALRKRLAHEGLELSFGWAAYHDDGVAPPELLRKADDRLYAAQLLSRNRRAVRAPAAAAHR